MSLSVVQSKASASTVAGVPTVTLTSTPTQGNLLVAFSYGEAPQARENTGWTLLITYAGTGATEHNAVYYKYAGASESTTQTPEVTSMNAWTLAMYEISGVSGLLHQDFAEAYTTYLGSGSSLAWSPTFNTALANELLLAAAEEATTAASTLSISASPASWGSADTSAQGTANGFNQSAFSWHQSVSTAGTSVAPTISSTTSFRIFASIFGLVTQTLSGPTIVQAKCAQVGNLTSVPSVTLNTAPTNGNLLVAVAALYKPDGAPSAGAGWTLDTSGDDGTMYTATYYKYAGAGESATQTPEHALNRNFWALAMFEVGNVGGTWGTDHVSTHLTTTGAATTVSPTSFNTSHANEVVLMGFGGPNSISSTANNSIAVTGGAAPVCATTGGATGSQEAYIGAFQAAPVSGIAIAPTFKAPQSLYFDGAIVEIRKGSVTTETANVSMAVTNPTFNVTANEHVELVTMAIGGMAFNVTETREETPQVALAIGHPNFNVQAHRQETGNVSLAIGNPALAVQAVDLSSLNKLRQFNVFG